MADVTLCVNLGCPQRMSCYRYRAKYGSWQSVANFSPEEAGGCSFFSSLRENDVLVTEEEADERTSQSPPTTKWPGFHITKGPMG